ncbi:MAG: carbonic anhydrase [Chitinophagaceae bacterium]|nr:carbonic anhydrase [Chitinophagaceae bacterium]
MLNHAYRRVTVMLAVASLFMLLYSCRHKPGSDQQLTTRANVLEVLMAGNYRFAHAKPVHPDESRQRMSEIAKEQHPFAVVISCSDSRVPPELIFDQGLGDLFVIRTAGNLMGGLEIGSVEYAVEHLGVGLIIVLGHQQCGAIKAFVDGGEAPGHIKDIIDSIKSEQEIREIPANDKNRMDHCVEANLRHATHQLLNQSAIIKEKVEKNELRIAAGIYDLQKGEVSMLKK